MPIRVPGVPVAGGLGARSAIDPNSLITNIGPQIARTFAEVGDAVSEFQRRRRQTQLAQIEAEQIAGFATDLNDLKLNLQRTLPPGEQDAAFRDQSQQMLRDRLESLPNDARQRLQARFPQQAASVGIGLATQAFLQEGLDARESFDTTLKNQWVTEIANSEMPEERLAELSKILGRNEFFTEAQALAKVDEIRQEAFVGRASVDAFDTPTQFLRDESTGVWNDRLTPIQRQALRARAESRQSHIDDQKYRNSQRAIALENQRHDREFTELMRTGSLTSVGEIRQWADRQSVDGAKEAALIERFVRIQNLSVDDPGFIRNLENQMFEDPENAMQIVEEAGPALSQQGRDRAQAFAEEVTANPTVVSTINKLIPLKISGIEGTIDKSVVNSALRIEAMRLFLTNPLEVRRGRPDQIMEAARFSAIAVQDPLPFVPNEPGAIPTIQQIEQSEDIWADRLRAGDDKQVLQQQADIIHNWRQALGSPLSLEIQLEPIAEPGVPEEPEILPEEDPIQDVSISELRLLASSPQATLEQRERLKQEIERRIREEGDRREEAIAEAARNAALGVARFFRPEGPPRQTQQQRIEEILQ